MMQKQMRQSHPDRKTAGLQCANRAVCSFTPSGIGTTTGVIQRIKRTTQQENGMAMQLYVLNNIALKHIKLKMM